MVKQKKAERGGEWLIEANAQNTTVATQDQTKAGKAPIDEG